VKHYLKFTGEYNQLKSLGFEFQKLYANDYLQWSKEEVRVWKKGAQVTIDCLTNYEGAFLKLLESNKANGKSMRVIDNSFFEIFVQRNTRECFNYEDKIELQRSERKAWIQWHGNEQKGLEPKPTVELRHVFFDDIAPFIMLLKKKWCELATY